MLKINTKSAKSKHENQIYST